MARKSRKNPNAGSAKKKAAKSGGNDGKKPKRIRRKCSHPECDNRVVQGGVCVTHGAKRKLCAHPGCAKAVKLAGFCSTHGPARKKCDHQGCTRVAVQGGKCLSHGARRRVCNYPSVGGREKCNKNAIMGGMCKKHYDRVQEAEGMLEMSLCLPINSKKGGSSAGSSSSEGESEGEEASLETTPYEAPPMVASSAVAAMAGSYPQGLGVESRYNSQTQESYAVPFVMMSGNPHPHSTITIKKPSHKGHQRGLSVFDDMTTVDAIIGTSAENRKKPPSYPQAQVSSAPPAVAMSSSSTSYKSYKRQASITKTPAAQVSFADSMNAARSAATSKQPPSEGGETSPPCTGDSSCSCNACRSPTLAIFEQMIQASQKLESGDLDTDKYVGLSPPKLSQGSKGEEEQREMGHGVAASEIETPRNANQVNFLPEEPSSSGSIIRKVSSNNIVGEAVHQQYMEARQDYPPPQVAYQQQAAPQVQGGAGQEGHESGNQGRTVSYDVDDPRRQAYGHHGPPHASAHYGAHHGHPQAQPPQQHSYQYPQSGLYGNYRDPYAQKPPQEPPSYQHHALPQAQPPYPPAPATHAHFQPPQTPTLYDSKTSEHGGHQAHDTAAVVSSHSAHHDQQLLPKRREAIEHLFIPKEV